MTYKNCRELPIHNFNEIGLSNDLSYLISDNSKHDDQELKDAWLDILTDFILINPDKGIKYENELKQRLFYLVNRLSVLEKVIEYDLYTDAILGKLKLKKKNVRREFNKVRQRTAQLRAKLKTEEKVEQEVNTFEKTLAQLTKFYGAKIDRFTTTVSEWLELKDTAFRNG